jgi:two-component system LytT family response regulator
MENVVIHTHKSIEIIRYKEIVRIEASGSYCIVHTYNNKFTASKNLSFFEKKLCPSQFFRSHRSHLVSINCVKRFNKVKQLLELTNGDLVPVSERALPIFIQMLENWEVNRV